MSLLLEAPGCCCSHSKSHEWQRSVHARAVEARPRTTRIGCWMSPHFGQLCFISVSCPEGMGSVLTRLPFYSPRVTPSSRTAEPCMNILFRVVPPTIQRTSEAWGACGRPSRRTPGGRAHSPHGLLTPTTPMGPTGPGRVARRRRRTRWRWCRRRPAHHSCNEFRGGGAPPPRWNPRASWSRAARRASW